MALLLMTGVALANSSPAAANDAFTDPTSSVTVDAGLASVSTATEPAPSPSPSGSSSEPSEVEYGGRPSGGGEMFAPLAVVSGVVIVGGALIVVLMMGRERRRRDRAEAGGAEEARPMR